MSLRSPATVLIALVALATLSASASAPDYIVKAVADPSRPADDVKLDAARKPAEVLAFADIKPGETIGEYLPGGGYYTRLLSNIVGPKGKVYALETTTWGKDNIKATQDAIKGHNNVSLDLAPLGSFNLPARVDVFWTTANYHDLHIPKYANVDMAAFNRHVFDSLKPGGIYFIVDHAAAAGTGAKLSPKLHRIEEATVVKEVTAAGFVRAGESNVLRNPADDHSKVVFDPSVRWRTDQFIVKFRKP